MVAVKLDLLAHGKDLVAQLLAFFQADEHLHCKSLIQAADASHYVLLAQIEKRHCNQLIKIQSNNQLTDFANIHSIVSVAKIRFSPARTVTI